MVVDPVTLSPLNMVNPFNISELITTEDNLVRNLTFSSSNETCNDPFGCMVSIIELKILINSDAHYLIV